MYRVGFTMWRILVLSVILVKKTAAQEQLINVASFTERLDELARDALGSDQIQSLFDNDAQFTTRPITQEMGAELADELSTILSSRFAEYFTALERTKQTVDKEYADNAISFETNTNYNHVYQECCKVNTWDLEYDARFFAEADPTSICYRVSADSAKQYKIPATKNILNAFEQNFADNPHLKWQYFGTEEGILVVYPESVASNCDNFDPRFRPWYVESSSPVPKDLVMVIDSSGSMSGNRRMEIAKDAAVAVVATLNPNDRIGIVRFSDSADTPPGNTLQSLCYNTDMAYAIPDNVRYLKSYIQSIQASGGTAYLPALTTAFELLQRVGNIEGQTRDKVILFLTDGEPTDSKRDGILAKISELNGQMNNAVTIMTYGLSLGDKADSYELLRDMALQVGGNLTKGDINEGLLTRINSVENLRVSLGSYYSHFSSKAALEKPIISVPYVDFFGLGLITSVCDTILHSGELKGATCIDVRIADILGDIEYAQPGELSYTFIIDKTGRTLVHPLMPSPFKVEDDPLFIDISMLERAPDASSVIASMKTGGIGNKTFMSNFTVGMGYSKQQGVEVKEMRATYQWRQITNSDLSFCMVFAESDEEVKIKAQGNTENFLYHRFDVKEPKDVCSHAARFSTIDESAVAFADEAFEDVQLLDSTTITPEDIERMTNYMSVDNYRWEALKDGVKDTVVVTEKMDKFWKSQNKDYGRYVTSRYVGTENGVFRVYPGISLPINYRHKERAWYSDAVANRDKLVMSVPYVDAFGAGIVTTIMHSILEGQQSHSSSDTIIGVIGADFSLAYLRHVLIDTYPQCDSGKYVCFLMDESGFMIYHPSVADEDDADDNRHIIKHEPEIAQVVIEGKYLVREECVSLGENKAWFTWKMENKRAVQEKTNVLSFEMYWVRDTNLFLGIKDKSSQTGNTRCYCPNGLEEFKCTRIDARVCECPCFAIGQYDYCSNSFHKESLPGKTCTPPKESKHYESPLKNEAYRADGLPLCFNVICGAIDSESECDILSSCAWCQGKCGTLSECADRDETSLSVGGIVGIVIAVVVVLVIVIACCVKSRKNAKANARKEEESRARVIRRTREEQSRTQEGQRSNDYSLSPSVPPLPQAKEKSQKRTILSAREERANALKQKISNHYSLSPSAPPLPRVRDQGHIGPMGHKEAEEVYEEIHSDYV